MAKPNALDKAITETRNKEAGIIDVPVTTTELAKLTNQDVQLERADMNLIVELMKTGDFEAAEQILVLEEGMMVRGQLLGRGEPATVEDPVTHGTKQLGTWRMRLNTGARVSFLSSAQLDRMLPEFIGRRGETVIVRGETKKHKGSKQLTEYVVIGPKAGSPRLGEGEQ